MQSVKVVAVSKPTISDPITGYIVGVDEFIAYVARVSNPSNQMNTQTAPKLLKYLAKHKHWSPFEMVSICMEIETTRDIARQILRHRSFSFQEFSQRYADPTNDLGFVTREARLQDLKNRQNSIETEDRALQDKWNEKQAIAIDAARGAYKWAVENGIAKEQARSVLPEGNIVSRMYMNGSLRSWIHYCELRMGVETQKEHREIALMAWNEITNVFPSLTDILSDTK
jgi:thymidylate synthase (FAD)